MSNKHDMGGPAYPSNPSKLREQGMTLWDYYAAAALTGLNAGDPDLGVLDAAQIAGTQADAMLAERAKRTGGER